MNKEIKETEEGKKAREALEKLQEKDGSNLSDAAQSNEGLLHRTRDLSKDEVKASIDANNPAGSHAAYQDGKKPKQPE
jgi:hypothetical protein